MIQLVRTNADDEHFQQLVKALDEDLRIRDGADHGFYNQFNKISNIPYAVVAYDNDLPLACGAIKPFSADAMEIKRMYVLPQRRGEGLAGLVLTELEKWALDLKFTRCVLETGKRQPEAIALYIKKGYAMIANYGQYAGMENSVCFEKRL